MISKTVKNYVENIQDLKSIENYEQAIQAQDFWECHHRLEIQEDKEMSSKELKELGLYWGRPPEELIFLPRKEHRRLHWKSKSGRRALEQARKKVLEKEERISWVKRFQGMTKQEISIFIENAELSQGTKSSLRLRFVYNTPKAYTRKRKVKKERIRKDWNKLLEGKTKEEIRNIIDKECSNCGQRTRLRKRFGCSFTDEERKIIWDQCGEIGNI